MRRQESKDTYEGIAFAAKAMDKKGRQHFTALVHAEASRDGTRLVATDGKRMHVTTVSLKLPAGDYRASVGRDSATLELDTQAAPFPSWRNVVPQETDMVGTIHLEGGRSDSERLSVAHGDIIAHTGQNVNITYLDELPKCTWRVYARKKGNGKNPLVMLRKSGDEDGMFAVIAPLAA